MFLQNFINSTAGGLDAIAKNGGPSEYTPEAAAADSSYFSSYFGGSYFLPSGGGRVFNKHMELTRSNASQVDDTSQAVDDGDAVLPDGLFVEGNAELLEFDADELLQAEAVQSFDQEL
eukprot:tig00021318_g20185.t1